MIVKILLATCVILLATLYFAEEIFGSDGPEGMELAFLHLTIVVVFVVTNIFCIFCAFKKSTKTGLFLKALSLLPIVTLAVYLSIPSLTTSRYDIQVLYAGPLDEAYIKTGGMSGIMKKGETRTFRDEGDIKFFTISIGRGIDEIELLEYNNGLNQIAPLFASHMQFEFTITGESLSYVYKEVE
ncbi:hypothetical protein [Cerasicoccus maritimus]|uniref:hypothetical protein n=1 Tax=Cerasicoccus maritimus TaxID=490089 RepID=UPI002852A3BD|nr:hypothetical protein [Cerasicoccus maritimus]